MKSILVGLTLICSIASFPAYTQTDTTYCLPLSKARLLVADALRLRLADSLNESLSQRIALLDKQYKTTTESFTNLLKVSEEKYQTQTENTGHMERLAMSYKDERDYYIKRERKQRRKKNLSVVLILILTGALIVR